MAKRLSQILAVEKQIKTSVQATLTDSHHRLQKGALLNGLVRSYRPKDEDGEKLPGEQTQVQVRATEVITEVQDALAKLFDVVATKEWGNTGASADVKVGDITLAEKVPATYLLFLQKQLVDIHTFVAKLPTLPLDEVWAFDPNKNAFATVPTETHRTKKVPQKFVKAEATDKHAAQVDVWYEDLVVGYWTNIKYSGALPAAQVKAMLARVESLQASVKQALEEANAGRVEDQAVGKTILAYVFGV
jgi:hypothetical protein